MSSLIKDDLLQADSQFLQVVVDIDQCIIQLCV